ncbi:MAG: hypothetical protein HQM08_06860 [Candidatus Riflebacteria bacterium]|nr:hypothetical protein [Candidatus Riflebacteria bacterium]
MLKRFLAISFVGVLLFVQCKLFALERYPIPSNVEMKLLEKPIEKNGEITFNVVVQGVAGTISNCTVGISSSPDLSVKMASTTIDLLEEGKEKKFSIIATRNKNVKSLSGTWARIKLSYFPDKKGLLQVVRNKSKYPLAVFREELREKIEKNCTGKNKVIEIGEFEILPDEIEGK